MGDMKSFGDFYTEIRNYFGTNVQEFEHFKRQGNGRKKIDFLLGHPEVIKALKKLQDTAPTTNVFERVQTEKTKSAAVDLQPQRTKMDTFKASDKFPQLSAKVALQNSKKKGRHLVAKEKILPGKCYLINRLVWVMLDPWAPKFHR
jgi:hypothetical protein